MKDVSAGRTGDESQKGFVSHLSVPRRMTTYAPAFRSSPAIFTAASAPMPGITWL
jgi:hypothetical protein